MRRAAAMVAWPVSKENSFTTASVFDQSGGRTACRAGAAQKNDAPRTR